MSNGGGIRVDQGQSTPGFHIGNTGKGEQLANTGHLGRTSSAEHIGRGFSTKNSISHQEVPSRAHGAMARDRSVRLPAPKVDAALVATPAMQAQISQAMDSTELLFTFDELLNQLSAEDVDEFGEGESKGSSNVYGSSRKRTMKGGPGSKWR